MRKRIISTLSALVAILVVAAAAFSQTTAFTYQGSLKDGANPANGNFDFEFKLFDAVSAGTQQGSTQQRLNVAVANGVFAVSLDFGAGTLPGANRFLEIALRTAGGGAFTTLAPRQQVNSAPYSIKSLNSANADVATNATQLGGVAANQYVTTANGGTSFIQNTTTQQAANFNINGNGSIGGNLGIGTAAPVGNLHINVPGSGSPISALTVDVGTFGTGTNAVNSSFFKVRDLGLGGSPAFLVRGDGNVGIGTASPQSPLHVNGNSGSFGITLTNAANNQGRRGYRIAFDNDRLTFQRATDEGGFSSNQMTIDQATGKVGIGTITPSYTLDVNGDIRYTGALLGTIPGPRTTMVQDTNFITPGSTSTLVPGLSNTVVVSGNVKLLVHYNVYIQSTSCVGCVTSTANLDLKLDGSPVSTTRRTLATGLNIDYAFMTGSWLMSVGPGSHTVELWANSSGPLVLFGCGSCGYRSNLIVQVIPD